MHEYDPLTGQRMKNEILILDRWTRLMETLNKPEAKSLREELFGVFSLETTPDRTTELSVMRHYEILPHQWESMSMNQQAELFAFYQLKNIEDTLRHYDETMKNKEKQKAKEAESRQKKRKK